jgi:hypothetical protein
VNSNTSFVLADKKIAETLNGKFHVTSTNSIVTSADKLLLIGYANLKSGDKSYVLANDAATVKAFQAVIATLGLEASVPVVTRPSQPTVVDMPTATTTVVPDTSTTVTDNSTAGTSATTTTTPVTTVTAVNPLTAPSAETFSARFSHPGLIHSQDQLNRFQIAANDPTLADMAQYYAAIANDPRAQIGAAATPYGSVNVGNTAKKTALLSDASIAYLNALQWVKTGNQAHANTAIQALNAWANTFFRIIPSEDGSQFQDNLVSSWALPMWLNAAEIIRYHKGGAAGWANADIQKFNDNFVNILYEQAKATLNVSTSGGGTKYESNWAASAALAAMSVGVFQDNVERYKLGLSHIKRLMPVLILEEGTYTIVSDPNKDGVITTYRNYKARDGMLKELLSREDCGHPGYTMRAFVQAAATAANQGDYSLLLMTNSNSGVGPLLLRGLEYMSDAKTGAAPTARACTDAALEGAGHLAFNTYKSIGVASPKAKAFVQAVGVEGQEVGIHFLGWSSATSYGKQAPVSTNAYCARGILAKDGISCCPAACGRCGGNSCETRSGGANACCSGRIQDAHVSCANHEAPCSLSSAFAP